MLANNCAIPARCRRGRPNPNPDFAFAAGFGLAIMFAGPDAVVTDTVCALRRPECANSVAPRGLARGRFAGAAACFALASGAGRMTPRPCFTAPWFVFAPEQVERLSIDHHSRVYDSGVGPRLHGSSEANGSFDRSRALVTGARVVLFCCVRQRQWHGRHGTGSRGLFCEELLVHMLPTK